MLRTSLIAVAVLAFGAANAEAQRFGGQVSWADDADLGLGARVEIPVALSSEGILAGTYIIGSFDYFFIDCDECSYMEFNGNFAAPIGTSSLRPYVGAGLNMARSSVDVLDESISDTEMGLNLLGGIKFGLGSLSSYAEARMELGGGEQFVLTFGILFGN
jgi:hypothetical protein